jgi:hypothetical protein
MSPSCKATVISLLATVGFISGCSSKKADDHAPEILTLREVEMMLRMPTPRMTPNGPDLTPLQNDFPLACRAIRSGDVIVEWGVQMPGEGEKSDRQEIIAYEKKAPTEGGYVLLMNGNIKKMSAQEFQAAPKATK